MRLVPKIFLWFWLGIVAVGGTLVVLTEVTHSRAKDDALWRDRYGPRVDLWARQATQILESEGTAALRKYIASFEVPPSRRNYLFDADGHEVLGQDVPTSVHKALEAMEGAANTEQRFFREGRAGGWREKLTPVQVESLVAVNEVQMRRFGYWPVKGWDPQRQAASIPA